MPIQKSDSQYFRNLHSKNQYSISSNAVSEPSDSDPIENVQSDPTLIMRNSLTTTSIQHNEMDGRPLAKPSPINVKNNTSTSFDANLPKPDDDEQLSSSKKFNQFALDSTKSNQQLLQIIEEQQNEMHVKRPSVGQLPPQPKSVPNADRPDPQIAALQIGSEYSLTDVNDDSYEFVNVAEAQNANRVSTSSNNLFDQNNSTRIQFNIPSS